MKRIKSKDVKKATEISNEDITGPEEKVHACLGTTRAWLLMALNGDEMDREWVRNRIRTLNERA